MSILINKLVTQIKKLIVLIPLEIKFHLLSDGRITTCFLD